MKNLARTVFLCVLTVSLLSLLPLGASVKASTKMPQFVLKSAVDGEEINSDAYAGKVLLISFFATWCPPCIDEIPTFNELQRTYGEKGFSVVALSVDQGGPAVVAKLVRKKSIIYPVLMADNETMQDFGGVYGVPVSFLINRDGNVVKKYPGYVPESILVKDIESVMN